MDRLPAEAEKLCAASPYDFSDLKAVFINCTLKRSPRHRSRRSVDEDHAAHAAIEVT